MAKYPIHANIRHLAANDAPSQARGGKPFLKEKDRMEMAVEFINKKGEVKLLKGWVREGDDFSKQMRSIFRQNGIELPLIYDERFGFGFGAIWFREWGAVSNFQYYIDGKLPVMGTADCYVGLNAGNLILKKGMTVTFREEEPQCPLGNMNINTKGIKLREWGEFDPRTNTVSWGKAAFAAAAIDHGEKMPVQPEPAWMAGEWPYNEVEGDFIAERAKVPPMLDSAGAAAKAWCEGYVASLPEYSNFQAVLGSKAPAYDGFAPGGANVRPSGFAAGRMAVPVKAAEHVPMVRQAGFCMAEPLQAAHLAPAEKREEPSFAGQVRRSERVAFDAEKAFSPMPQKAAEVPYLRERVRAGAFRMATPGGGRAEFKWDIAPSRINGRGMAGKEVPAYGADKAEERGTGPARVKRMSGISAMLRRQEKFRRKKVEERRNRERRKVSVRRPVKRKGKPKRAAAAGIELPKGRGRKEFWRFKEIGILGEKKAKGRKVARGPVQGAAVKEKAARKKRVAGRAKLPPDARKPRRQGKGTLLDEEARKVNRKKERAGEKRRGKDAVEYLAAKRARRPKKRKRWAAISKR